MRSRSMASGGQFHFKHAEQFDNFEGLAALQGKIRSMAGTLSGVPVDWALRGVALWPRDSGAMVREMVSK